MINIYIYILGILKLIDKIAIEYHHDNKYVLGNPGVKEKYVEQYKCISWFLEDAHVEQIYWGR